MALARNAPGIVMGEMRPVQDAAAALVNADTPPSGLTAKAGGGQATATQLLNGLNEITTCATNADSVQLPPAIAGTRVYVGNSGVANATVYGKNGRTDTINGTAGSTGFTLATTKNATFFCAVTGKWRVNLTA